ncbi:MAG TPA: hypothetical protein VEG27_03445 [Usitatibacter sp.]|nr:hypothetical protein [Usitatibacter sp.]
MSRPWGWWVLLSWLVLVGAGTASAQTSSFAGSWTGTIGYSSSVACTAGGVATPTITCTGSLSWNGSVDSQGYASYQIGSGTTSCSDGFSTPTGFEGTGNTVLTPIPSNGVLSFPSYSSSGPVQGGGSFTFSCPAWSLQFSGSPPHVSGTETCTSVTTTPNSTCNLSEQLVFSGGGSGSPPANQVFPMTVSSNITSTTASATATVQPPSQLVGTMGSVFVFAHAPQSMLAGSKRASGPIRQLDGTTPDPCVLAQVDSSGQLVGASASTLAAYTTGVLAAANQSVTILNNVPTPNVAGASFFVGYGASSSSMLSSGTYEGAVSVSGASSCSAALLTGAAPQSPGGLSGLWWDAAESGWGVSFTQRRNIVFAAWYTYDGSGNPKWYVASDCEMPSGTTGTSGTCNGTLYEVSGPTFFGTTFDPSLVHAAAAGSLSVAFQDANTASLSYTVAGQSRTVPIARQPITSGTTPPAVDYTDLWWNPSESGWGLSVTQQYGVMFLAWYVYDGNGKPMWYVASNCVVSGSGCSGTLYRTTGPAFGPTFDPMAVHAFEAGTVSLTFTDANDGALSYTVNGVSSTKTITRQVF